MAKWLKIFLTLIVIGAGIIGYYGYHLYDAINKAYQPSERLKSDKRPNAVDISEDPVSILLMGVDKRQHDSGRSDTLMVMTINPKEKSVQMMNIPRDTYVEIPGHGYDKINHAYAYGGTDLTIRTVEDFLDIPIDHYAKVNMEGFRRIVDELGGVTVHVPFTFEFRGELYEKGKMTLNGDEALGFAQMRKADPRGDFGRNDRQQQVIKGILEKGTSVYAIPKLDNILKHVGENVVTDISPIEMIQLQRIYSEMDRKQMESIHINGTDRTIGGIYYFVVDPQEKQRIQHELKHHLQLDSMSAWR
jgi:polyisoprenyl-teichoic acid--peptidoglycan teichoic acid transferase